MNKKWDRLDNVAKIFPAIAGRTDSQVFRLSCELYEDINPEMLQRALDETMRVFSLYKYVLRRGLFWYYLESRDVSPTVKEEHLPPCTGIYNKNRRTLLFEVTYFKNRVNLELFHVLSDGTGATQFLKTLITKYLSLVYEDEEPAIDYDASHSQRENDSFSKYYNDSAYKKMAPMPDAYRLSGFRNKEDRLKVVLGYTDVEGLKKLCKSREMTITEYLCAVYTSSILETVPLRLRKKPIVLAVPVNLRKYFPSDSARNFFVLIYTSYIWKKDDTFEDILNKMKRDFESQLTEENLTKLMNANIAAEHNLFARIAPLPLKDIVLKIIYRKNIKKRTATISNLGKITMPPGLEKYVVGFEMFSGTDSLHLSVCSFGNRISLGFSSPFEECDVQRNFFRELSKEGLPLEISCNITEDE